MRLSPAVKGETPEQWHDRHVDHPTVPIRKYGSTSYEGGFRDEETGHLFHTPAVLGYLVPTRSGQNRKALRSAHHRVNEERAIASRLHDDGGKFKRAHAVKRDWGFRRFPVYRNEEGQNVADFRLPGQGLDLPLLGRVTKLVVDGKVIQP